jgi:putative tryptophan/tyrosine transport system substrate-binding protein
VKRRSLLSAALFAVLQSTVTMAQEAAPAAVGFIDSSSPEVFQREVAGFRGGLAEAGFTEGQTVRIEYRWARGRYEQLPALAAELVGSGRRNRRHRRHCSARRSEGNCNHPNRVSHRR